MVFSAGKDKDKMAGCESEQFVSRRMSQEKRNVNGRRIRRNTARNRAIPEEPGHGLAFYSRQGERLHPVSRAPGDGGAGLGLRSRIRGSAKAPVLDPRTRERRNNAGSTSHSRARPADCLSRSRQAAPAALSRSSRLLTPSRQWSLTFERCAAGKRRSVADLVVAGFPTAAAVVEPVSPQANVELSLAEDAVLLAFATVLDLIALATASSGLDGHRHTLACLRIARNVPSVTVSRGPMSPHEARVLQKQWIIDGDSTRWLGVVFFATGGALRIWPVFVLGRRFSGLVAIQPEHTLVTTGVYHVIRHPSYLGLLTLSLCWALAFRSWIGALLADSWSRRSWHAPSLRKGGCGSTSAVNTMPTGLEHRK